MIAAATNDRPPIATVTTSNLEFFTSFALHCSPDSPISLIIPLADKGNKQQSDAVGYEIDIVESFTVESFIDFSQLEPLARHAAAIGSATARLTMSSYGRSKRSKIASANHMRPRQPRARFSLCPWPIESESHCFSLLPFALNDLPKSVSLSAPPAALVWHCVHGSLVCAVNAGVARTGLGVTRAIVVAANIAAPAATTQQEAAIANRLEILLRIMRVFLPLGCLRDVPK